jgi:hypothetical protein
VIKGPNISFRLLGNDDDELVFQCLKDWPADARGPFTRRRAMDTADAGMRENMLIHHPLTEESDFFVTFVIEDSTGAIGVTKARIWGTSVWVEWLALLPTARGRGLFREIRLAWSALTFEIFHAEKVGFETRTDVAATLDIFDRYTGETSDEVRKRGLNTDAEKLKWWHTKDNHLADRDEGMKDRDGNRITFEATP